MALPGTLFEYLSAFVTIVIALAVTDMATSLHRLIRARARVRWRVLPLVAALFIFLTLITIFFDLWRATRFDGISFYGLLALLIVPMLTFLAAAAVLPDEIPAEGIDLWDHYIGERRYIWGTMLLALVADTAMKLPTFLYDAAARPFIPAFATATLLALVATSLMLVVSDRRAHALGLAAMLVAAQIGYSGWAIKAPNARQEPSAASSPGKI